MNKSELIDVIMKNNNMKRKEAELAVNAVLGEIENALASGDKVQLMGFGTFEVKARAERVGRNPRTKEAIKIPASKSPVFSAGRVLKDSVNK